MVINSRPCWSTMAQHPNILASMERYNHADFYFISNSKKALGIFLISGVMLLVSACSKQSSEPETSQHVDARSLLELHNQARAQGLACGRNGKQRAPRLSWNSQLANAALTHSKNMHQAGRLTHKGKRGSSTKARLADVGYNWQAYGENIAAGTHDTLTIFKLWAKSDTHCENIANESFTEMGAAHWRGYWTVVFGRAK